MKVSGYTGTFVFLLYLLSYMGFSYALTTPCLLRPSTFGSVCVCNVTYCDFLDPVTPTGVDGFVLTSSSKMGLRFSSLSGKFSDKTVMVKDYGSQSTDAFEPMVMLVNRGNLKTKIQPKVSQRKVKIKVDRNKKFQKVVGFGGAFTGAVSHILETLPQELQDAVYQSFYSKKGIGYTMMRMPIGGSDFDLAPWAYNELPEDDVNLSNFTQLHYLDEKKAKQIEQLKLVSNIDKIKIMATAWSSPKWMKTRKSWNGLSFLRKKYYQTWADYHLRFLEIMEAKNMPIWAISTGNEPLNGVFGWVFIHFMSLGWTPSSQAEWLADNLGPTIRNSKFKDVKIFGNEDQRYTFPFWFKQMNQSRPKSIDYLDGLTMHWYWDEYFGPTLIDETHKLMPDKLLISSESCAGAAPLMKAGVQLGSWERGERYAYSLFEDLQHSFNGYVDWNLILNEQGGPNYVDNVVDAPIIANVTSGQEIYKQPIFYVLGHFSKFIHEGSIRIEAEPSNISILTVAFERPDTGTIACVFFNSAQAEVVVTLADSIRGNIEITIPPKSLHTIEYN